MVGLDGCGVGHFAAGVKVGFEIFIWLQALEHALTYLNRGCLDRPSPSFDRISFHPRPNTVIAIDAGSYSRAHFMAWQSNLSERPWPVHQCSINATTSPINSAIRGVNSALHGEIMHERVSRDRHETGMPRDLDVHCRH